MWNQDSKSGQVTNCVYLPYPNISQLKDLEDMWKPESCMEQYSAQPRLWGVHHLVKMDYTLALNSRGQCQKY